MDIRGVEITNQLRSAIRAKLLELGVRYDEELPDYILVMVVNKKSRQQMNEDLNLFLEDNTETFVDWLHDQVLKKLQKVTVAKKKKIIPTVVPKLEENSTVVKSEEKKLKVEDQSQAASSSTEVLSKQERDREFEELVGDLALLNEEDSKANSKELVSPNDKTNKKSNSPESTHDKNKDGFSEKTNFTANKDPEVTTTKSSVIQKQVSSSQNKISHEKIGESSTQNLKRTSNVLESNLNEKNNHESKRSKISYDSDSESDKKLKSNINKPKITSVVSVKTRLGVSPTKKFESQSKSEINTQSLLNKNHISIKKKELIDERSSISSQIKILDKKKQRNDDHRADQSRKDKIQTKNIKSDKSSRNNDLRDKERPIKKHGTIKSRLGSSIVQEQNKISLKPSSTTKISKPKISNVKSRLGIRVKPNRESLEDDEDIKSNLNTSLKSHIIAVVKSRAQDSKLKSLNKSKKQNEFHKSNNEEITLNTDEEDDDQSKVPSKIIVTPRPLKPLQPFQRRATQSLLLKAVAEANKSVVMQKKIDPCLKEQKSKKSINIVRDPKEGKILSINLNPKKNLMKEKIQVELDNTSRKNYTTAHSSRVVSSEHLDLVKSLFKKSDDNQKFLVTLNGYNNNVFKDENSDEELEDYEDSEIDANEEDEINLDIPYEEIYIENDQINDDYDFENDINEDIDIDYNTQQIISSKKDVSKKKKNEESPPIKKKKIKPIVYDKSRSNSPENKPTLASTISSVLRIDKKPLINSVITTVTDKSSEQCRYWPSCTLGVKCAYYHPEVPCSSFPACKFGEKCAYKHPNCKFGSSCTKVGCIFSHPPMQCKYHPYCMKPGCPFSHPKTSASVLINSPLTPDLSSVRAKFTWKKKE